MTDDLAAIARECGGIRSGSFDAVKQWTFTEDGLAEFVRRTLPAGVAASPGQQWMPIETAPKNERLLLWFPEFGAWIASAWPGSWSYAREQWVIHSPFGTPDGKALMGTDAPQPTHWQPQLSCPVNGLSVSTEGTISADAQGKNHG